MNVQLTDHLTCPRCGPAFGLVLLAHDVVERRVREGELGCPNCRDRYVISQGFADLRAPPRGPLPDSTESAESDPEIPPMALAAALGVAEGPGYFVFVGRVGRAAGDVAALVRDIEVVAADPAAVLWPPRPGVSRMVAWPGLPFRGAARGVVLHASDWEAWGEESVRVAAPKARVVVVGRDESVDPPDVPGGLEVVLEEGGLLILARP